MIDERNDAPEVAPAAQLPPAELVKEFEARLLSKGLAQPQARTAVEIFQSLTYKSHRGPLPPAEEFAGYEAVFPGAAKEILDMAVRQQQHAH